MAKTLTSNEETKLFKVFYVSIPKGPNLDKKVLRACIEHCVWKKNGFSG